MVRVLKLGYALPHDSHYGAGADAFCNHLSVLTNGTWQIEQHPNGFLGGEREMIENLRKGQLDLAIVYTGVLSSVVPSLGLLDLPFLFRNMSQVYAVLDGPIGDAYLAQMRPRDMVGLAWGENGLRHITNSKRPIRTPDDLRGLRVRVPQSDVMVRCFRQLGADTAPLSFTALRGALESGAYDGQENSISTIRVARLDEVQHYLTLSGHTYGSTIFAMSRDCWEELGHDEQQIFVQAARAGGEASRRSAQALEKTGLEAIIARGNDVVLEIDRAAFRAALEPTWSQIAGQFGEPLVDRIRATP